MSKRKKYMQNNKSKFVLYEVSAFINGIKHTFIGNNILILDVPIQK